jgi:adenosylcobinamide amidohydrolase
MMTGVKIANDLTILRHSWKALWVEGFITVGVSNAVRAGDPATYDEADQKPAPVGTINMILLTNARLSDAAMVEAIQVATEAKTATLIDSGIRSWTSSKLASGTGTDCTAIVSGHGRRVSFSGTHTRMGELIGRVVTEGILQGLKRCRVHGLGVLQRKK